MKGIGVPVAFTILHFMYSGNYPIMDMRTVEVLQAYGYITRKSRDLKRFPEFQDAVLSIQNSHPRWSLRQIDRAIFAFHKNNPELFRPGKRKKVLKRMHFSAKQKPTAYGSGYVQLAFPSKRGKFDA